MKLGNLTCGGCGCILLIVLGIGLLMGHWTETNLEFWLTHFKGETVDVPHWLAFLLACTAPLALLFNCIAEICKYAI